MATHIADSTGRLAVAVPAGAISQYDVRAAGGRVTLRISEITEPSGASAGGSGRVLLGTYLIQLLDTSGDTVIGGLRTPVTVTIRPTSTTSAIDLSKATMLVGGALPPDAALAPAGTARIGMQPAKGLISRMTGSRPVSSAHIVVPTLNRTTGTLTAAVTLVSAVTAIAVSTPTPVDAFGTANPFSVGIDSGSLNSRYPIATPAGPGGLTPPLAFVYDSAMIAEQHNPQGAAPWAGEGWDLSLGRITWKENLTGAYWENTWQLQDPFGISDQLIPPNVNVSTFYDDKNGTSPTAEPITWHTATESHANIHSYTGPLSLPGTSLHPPCFRVFLPNGVMEEYGCTLDSLQYYPSNGKYFVSSWLLDLITDPHGNQIHVTYQQDMTSVKSGSVTMTYPRDSELATVEWDSPSCVGVKAAQQACTASATGPNTWAPLMRVSFQAAHAPARFTGTPTSSGSKGCSSTPLRCDDPTTGAPRIQNTFVLNDVLVQVRGSASASWNTLRDYRTTFEQSAPTTYLDPWSGVYIQAAGKLNLTALQEVGDDGSTALPARTFTYTSLTQYYTDMDFAANPGPTVTYLTGGGIQVTQNNCGPSWNWWGSTFIGFAYDVNNTPWQVDGCALWSQSYDGNSWYMASASNGLGLAQTFSWADASPNVDGTSNAANPFNCQGPCNTWNVYQEWSRVVLISQTRTVLRPSSAGAQPVSDTTSYTYRLTTPVPAQATCKANSRCFKATMYYRPLFHFDPGDFNDERFMGFAEVDVTNADGSVEKHHYYTTMGIGIYDTNIPCTGNFCHASPWWSPQNALHGREYEDDLYDTDGVTLLRQTKTQYSLTCPPSGVSPTPAWTDSKDTDHGFPYTFTWDGQLVSELNNTAPVSVCDIQTSQVDTYTWDGATSNAANARATRTAASPTALTLYESLTDDSLLPTARQATTSPPSQPTAVATTVGGSTGWVELQAQGGSGTIGTTEPPVSGAGFIWDTTSLEDGQIPAGTWSLAQELRTTSGTVTADVHIRVFKRSADGAFTLIAEASQPGVSIGYNNSTATLPAVTAPGVCFSTGDKLYYDVVLNITSNSMGSSGGVRLNENGTASAMTTPGYLTGCATPPPDVPHSTTTYSYDGYGRVTQSTIAINDGSATGSSTNRTTLTTYAQDDAVTATSSGVTGTYLVDLPASTVVVSADGTRHLACTFNGYDGQPYTQGQTSTLLRGDLTSVRTDTSCGTAQNSFAPSGDAVASATYDQYGNLVASDDPDANAGIASHRGCLSPGDATLHSQCVGTDGTFATQIVSLSNALGQTATQSYGALTDPAGGFGMWPTATTDPNGQTSTTSYDPLGRPTATTLPGETTGLATTATSYKTWCSGTAAQAPCLEIDQTQRLSAAGTVTARTFYDGWGRPVETRTPAAGGQDTIVYTYYDPSGRVVFVSDPYFVPAYTGAPGPNAFATPDASQPGTTTSYANLRSTSRTDALSQTTTSAVSVACGQAGTGDKACYVATADSDPRGVQHIRYLDALGRTAYERSYSGVGASSTPYAITTYSYNELGLTTHLTLPDGTTGTSTAYDDSGRVVSTTAADRGVHTYAYDPNGNIVMSVDARGTAGTVYGGYDGLDRPIWRNTTNSPQGAYITYSYDDTSGGNLGVGRLTGETFSGGLAGSLTGSEDFTYDARGRAVATNLNIGTSSYPQHFSYDDADHQVSRTYPDGETVSYARDAAGWLSQATVTRTGTTTTLLSNPAYTGPGGARGLVTAADIGNGVYRYAATYDTLRRITDTSMTRAADNMVLLDQQRTFDSRGNVITTTTTLPTGTDQQQFCYDDQNRLTWAGATGTPPCTGVAITPGTLTAAQYQQQYSYDNLDRTTTGPAGDSVYGDPAHPDAMTGSSTGYSAGYDAAGNLTCRAAPGTGGTCAGSAPTGALFGYDNAGRLATWNSAPGAPAASSSNLYDGSDNLVEQQASANGVTTTTAFIDGIEEVSTDGTTTNITTSYYVAGARIAVAVNGTLDYIAADALGSPTIALDPNGNAAASVLYTPYGTPRLATAAMPTDAGFTGQRTDRVTGLDDYGARFYDPVSGQFAGADTVNDGVNAYAYVHHDPETLTDPTGNSASDDGSDLPPDTPWWGKLAEKFVKGLQGAAVVTGLAGVVASGGAADTHAIQPPAGIHAPAPAGAPGAGALEGLLGGDDGAVDPAGPAGPGAGGAAPGGGDGDNGGGNRASRRGGKQRQPWDEPGFRNSWGNRLTITDLPGAPGGFPVSTPLQGGQTFDHPYVQPLPPQPAFIPPATTLPTFMPADSSPVNPVQALNTAASDPAATTPAWAAPSVTPSWTPSTAPIDVTPAASSPWTMDVPSLTSTLTDAWNWYTGLPAWAQFGIAAIGVIGIAAIGAALLPEELFTAAVGLVGTGFDAFTTWGASLLPDLGIAW